MQQVTLSKEKTHGRKRERPVAPVSSVAFASGRRMTVLSRLTLAILAAGMLLAYIFPLWNIWLDAPQYPEGLGLQIWLNQITGDLNTINSLNHYIGMKNIEPEAFKELVYMPYIIGGLIALGLIAAASGKRYMLYLFAVVIVTTGIIGTIDFYLWEYDYGHNLDPRAAINIPGMTYQPPLIGSKDLLNFTASSWPGVGGGTIIAAALGAVLLSFYEIRKQKKKNNKYSNESNKTGYHHEPAHQRRMQHRTRAAALRA